MGESKGKIIALSIVLMVLPSIFVPLRFVARRMKKAPIQADDILIVPALLFLIGMGVSEIIASTAGNLGQHETLGPYGGPHPDPKSIMYAKMLYVQIVLQNFSNGLAKLSILFLYRRIFRGNLFDWISKAFVAVITAWIVGFLIPSIFQCNPIPAYWGPMLETVEKCFDFIYFYLAYAITDLITDVMILSLPVPMVWGLHMPTRRKVSVSCIFLLGTCVVAVGAARLWIFYDMRVKQTQDPDLSYNGAPSWYWTLVESAIAIICACLPTLGPLVSDTRSNVGKRVFTLRQAVRSKPSPRHSQCLNRQEPNSGTCVPTYVGGKGNDEREMRIPRRSQDVEYGNLTAFDKQTGDRRDIQVYEMV